MENLLSGGLPVVTINPDCLCCQECINLPLKGMMILRKIVLGRNKSTALFLHSAKFCMVNHICQLQCQYLFVLVVLLSWKHFERGN